MENETQNKTISLEFNIEKPKYGKEEKRRIFKNCLVLSFSFTLLFTAYSSMSSLQSSINSEDGLGVYSQSVVYACLTFSALFMSTYIIRTLSVKWTIPISMFGYILYIAGQFYPTFATLLPTGALVGLFGSSLWSAKCTYLSVIGREYAKLDGTSEDVILTKFFGIFFLLFQSSSVWGNLISSTVLGSSSEGNKDENIDQDDFYGHCGFNFCPWDNITQANPNLKKPSLTKIYTLASIYLCTAIAAIVFCSILLDPLTRYGENERKGTVLKNQSASTILKSTFIQMRKPYQILLIPITFWGGFEQGFLGSDFTQAYISCAWGIDKIGYVLICYGICDAIGSISLSPIVKLIGRIYVILFGGFLNAILIFTFIYWIPRPDSPYLFFIVAGLWGFADSIWQTQINAIYGIIFSQDEEACFSNYKIWESLGFILAFVLTDRACINAKLYLLLTSLILGLIGYLALEYLIRKRKIKGNNEKS